MSNPLDVGTVNGGNALLIRAARLFAPLPARYEVDWMGDGSRGVRVIDLDRGEVYPISWQLLTVDHHVTLSRSVALGASVAKSPTVPRGAVG